MLLGKSALIMKRSSDDGITYVSWSNASIPTTVLDKTIKQMTPPTLLSKDANSITLKWDNNTVTTSNDGYRLRYRIDTDITWHNIDSIIIAIHIFPIIFMCDSYILVLFLDMLINIFD